MDGNYVGESASDEATIEMSDALNTASGSLELSGTASPVSEVVSDAAEEPCPESSSCGGLAALEIAAVLPLLKTCVDQLHILSFTNRKPRVTPNMKYKTLEERFGVPREKDKVFQEDTLTCKDLPMTAIKLKKLQCDRAFLEETLELTIRELNRNGTFLQLCSIVLQDIVVSFEEKELISQEMRNTAEVKYLQKKIIEEAKEINNKLYKRDEIIAKLKDESQDVFFDSKMQLDYVDGWEKARLDQKQMQINIIENELQDTVFKLRRTIDRENRVNESVRQFIFYTQENLEYAIRFWQEKYTIDLESRELAIEKLKAQRATHLTELEDMQVLYDQHQQEIDDYLQYRKEKEEKEAHEMFLNMTATKIQAWWRGTMVRRCLGPFRKKKGGKGKDAKGKGGKKGKKK